MSDVIADVLRAYRAHEFPAGRTLDVAVAVTAMGWQIAVNTRIDEGVAPYSTDLAAAGELAESMRRRGFSFRCSDQRGDPRPMRASAEFFGGTMEREDDSNPMSGETLPLAICRAALAALEAPDA